MKSFYFELIVYLLVTFFFSCSDIKRPSIYNLFLFQAGNANIGVITSDFGGGGRYNVLDLKNASIFPGFTPIHSDASIRFWNGKVYIINKLNKDSIQVLNPNIANITELEFSVGAGTNPHDILVLSSIKAYVSRYNSRSILIVNPSNGAWIGEIDLSMYSETSSSSGNVDGLAEMSWMVKYNERVFVTLQRLDRNHPRGFFPPTDKSFLVEIDPVVDKPIRVYTFQSKNPISKPQILDIFGAPHIIFATPGRLGFLSELDGGVEAFNLNFNTFRSGFLIHESVVGGDILSVQIKNESLGFLSVLDSQFNKKIVSFHPTTGQVLQNILEVPNILSTNFSGLLLTNEGYLIVGVRDFSSSGIHIFDTNSNLRQLTLFPIRTELTPTEFEELK